MIFTECACGQSYSVGYECGDKNGYARIDCICGKILMVELSSFGITTVLDESELEKFIEERGLLPDKIIEE